MEALGRLIHNATTESGCVRSVPWDELRYKRLAIDAPQMLYQHLFVLHDGTLNEEAVATAHLTGFFYVTIRLLEHDVIPIYVFDQRTDAPSQACKSRVYSSDRAVRVRQSEVDECLTMLRLMGVPVIEAADKAAAECAALVRGGRAYAALSTSLSLLVYGCPLILNRLPTLAQTTVSVLSLGAVLAWLRLDMNQFVDLCIVMGTDYNARIYGLGEHRATEMLRVHFSIEGLLPHLDPNRHTLPSPFPYQHVRVLFKSPPANPPIDLNTLQCKAPDYVALHHFLVNSKGFEEECVMSASQRIRTARERPKMISIKEFFTPKSNASLTPSPLNSISPFHRTPVTPATHTTPSTPLISRFPESPASLTYRRNEPSDPISAALLALSELRQAAALAPAVCAQIKEMLLSSAPHNDSIAGFLAAYDVERDLDELRDSLARFGQRLERHGAPADFDSYRAPAPHAAMARGAEITSGEADVYPEAKVPVRVEVTRVPSEEGDGGTDDEADHAREQEHDEAIAFPSLPPLRDPGTTALALPQWLPLDDGAVYVLAPSNSGSQPDRIAVFGWEGTLVTNGLTALLRPATSFAYLRALSRAGYLIVVCDHARGITSRVASPPPSLHEFLTRTAELLALIGAPVHFILSVNASHRPPAPTILRLLASRVMPRDLSSSFLIGSAAGRSGDRSAADRWMARKLRIAFRTPEELWDDGPPSPYQWVRVNTHRSAPVLPVIVSSADACTVSEADLHAIGGPCLVLLIGSPASGKSALARRVWSKAGWCIVTSDAMNLNASAGMAHTLQLVSNALNAGLSVVVDGMHPSVASRAPYMQLAEQHRVPVHALLVATSEATARVLSRMRVALGESRRQVAKQMWSAVRRAYQPPLRTNEPHFASILLLPFTPVFDSPEHASVYRSLLAEP